MHPLVKRHLRAFSVENMRAWEQRGARIKNVDMVAWTKAHEGNSGMAHIEKDSAAGSAVISNSPNLSVAGIQRTLSRRSSNSVRGGSGKTTKNLSNSIVLRLKKRGAEIHEQFTGDDYEQVFEEQKQLLLETLVHISSDQLETVMQHRFFGYSSGSSKSVTRPEVVHRMTLLSVGRQSDLKASSRVTPSADSDTSQDRSTETEAEI